MNTTAQCLFGLAQAIEIRPWPTTPEERAQWSIRVGLPSSGQQINDSEPPLAFTAPSHGGHAYWDIAPSGQLEHVSVILATLDPAEFYSLKTDAETLRTFLDQAWQLVDSDVKGASWRAEWRSGAIDIEVYWSDPSRDEPPVEAALHIAFSPVKATDVQPTTAWKAILHDSARDIVYAPEIWCEPPATTLRVVRFVSANGALVGSVTVFSPSDIGATGDGGDAISVRTLATTMAINLAEDDVPQVQGRALLEDALAASRWGQTITVLVDGQPYAAWALECRAGLWAVYLRMDALLVAAAFRTDPRNLSLHVTTAVCCNAEVSAGPARAVEVDERDSHWEVNSPTFRVYIHDSETDTTRGATATYDITGVDVLQAVDWAQRHTRDDQTWALALVLDDEATEALSPGHGRGLVWLLGADGNDSDTAPHIGKAQRRMLDLRSTRSDASRGNPSSETLAKQTVLHCRYDQEADAAYIAFADRIAPGEVANTIPVTSPRHHGVANLDVDREGRLLGLEVLAASQNLRHEMLH